MQEATELIKNKDYSKAIHLLESIIKKNPDNVSAIYKAGLCYTKTGEFLKAKNKFESIINVDVQNVELWQQYSFILFQLGKLIKSIKALEKADSLNPDDLFLHHQLAFLHYQLKNYPKALEYIDRAHEINQIQYSGEPILEILNLKALISENLNKKDAIKVYFSILESFENNAASYDRLSSLILDKFNFKENFNELTCKNTDYNKATLLLRSGKLEESIYLYKKSIQNNKYCYPAYLGIAQALYESKFGLRNIKSISKPHRIEGLFTNYDQLNHTEKNIVNSSVSLLQNFIPKLINNKAKFTIVPIDTKLTDYPENLHLKNKDYIEGVSFCTLRGIGGDNAFVGIERVRDFLWRVDSSLKFVPACIAHEFGHMVWALLDNTTTNKIKELYIEDYENNNLISIYSKTNEQEYFAEYYAYCSRLIAENIELTDYHPMIKLIENLKKL